MDGIILIAVLAVMGGLIAYMGDYLGTKVGKKKFSVFGLRPKHTSILVTIVTGILISGSTLGVMSLVSRDVRTALFGMEALKAQLTTLEQDVKTKSSDLADSYAALDAKTLEYAGLETKIKTTSARLATLSSELAVVAEERDHAAAALQQAQAEYNTEIKSLQATKNELDTRIATLSEAKSTLQADIDHLNELTNNLRQGIQVVREGAIIYRAGEVLSTISLPGGGTRTETEQALTAAIYRTNQLILDRLNIEDKSLEVLWISQKDFEEAVQVLSNSQENTIVRVSSSGNSVYGEPIIGRIDMFPNQLIYAKGMKVYSEKVEAGRDSQQSEETVLAFLNNVNATAIKQGILPDPIEGTVGSMSGAQLYDAVNKVKRANGKIEMTAVAKTDIYAIGPLKIEILVRNMP